ncbi:hypothetical protein V9U70_00365 [Streptomyces pratensis]
MTALPASTMSAPSAMPIASAGDGPVHHAHDGQRHPGERVQSLVLEGRRVGDPLRGIGCVGKPAQITAHAEHRPLSDQCGYAQGAGGSAPDEPGGCLVEAEGHGTVQRVARAGTRQLDSRDGSVADSADPIVHQFLIHAGFFRTR